MTMRNLLLLARHRPRKGSVLLMPTDGIRFCSWPCTQLKVTGKAIATAHLYGGVEARPTKVLGTARVTGPAGIWCRPIQLLCSIEAAK